MTKRSRPKSRQRTVRLYTDIAKNPESYWRVRFSDCKKAIQLLMSLATLETARRGYPWECWIAETIKRLAKENPELFPHPVLYVYVTRSTIYIVDQYKNGQPFHAVRYVHSLGPVTKNFDKLTRAEFLKTINGGATELPLLMRRRVERSGEYKGDHKSSPTGERTKTVVHGAKRRAIDAGLLPGAI